MTESEFLATYNIRHFERPSITTDIVLFTLDKTVHDIKQICINGLQVLLIQRNAHPYKDKWALPGGFCRPTETVSQTAKRELQEETGVSEIALKPVGTYSDTERDPRGWIISNAFMGLTPKNRCILRADTDAWDAAWFTIQDFNSTITETRTAECAIQTITHRFMLSNNEKNEMLHSTIIETRKIYPTHTEISFCIKNSDLAFDHGQIICETFLTLKETLKHDIRLLFDLFPPTFTIGELQKAYEVILNTKIQNFRRSIQNYVKETDITAEKSGYRPAKLYIKNTDFFIQSAYT